MYITGRNLKCTGKTMYGTGENMYCTHFCECMKLDLRKFITFHSLGAFIFKSLYHAGASVYSKSFL